MPLERIPRVRLATLPTPLQPAPRLSAALGGPQIFVKRDDLTGLAFGGNKTRKLEYLMADAQRQGADVVLTVGAAQSNHARQTAAAARQLGLRCILVLTRSQHNELQGNLLLDALLGAEVQLIDPAPDRPAAQVMEEIAARERARGHRPYLIPGGGSNGVGCLGYVGCALELAWQLAQEGIRADYVYVASGSGGTQGGLVLGARLYHAAYQVVGISPGSPATVVRQNCARVATEGARRLGVDLTFGPEDFTVSDAYVGPGYAVLTPAAAEAIRLFAQTEGIILDPVYTAKAAAGLIDHIRRGQIRSDQTVVFIHTGGTPALFAYHQELGQTLQTPAASGVAR